VLPRCMRAINELPDPRGLPLLYPDVKVLLL
jgi:hypothetical protein